MTKIHRAPEKGKVTILDQYRGIQPEGSNPIFKLVLGQVIVAKGRREATTSIGDAKALDIEILENSGGEIGKFTIFESKHLTKIFDKHNLQPGDRFVLKLADIDKKSGFRRYAFQVIESKAAQQPPVIAVDDDDDIAH